MAITFVQQANASAVGAQATSPSMTFALENLIIVVVQMGNGTQQSVTAVTDTIGNTYFKATNSHAWNASVFGGTATEVWCCPNCIGGTGTVKATWNAAGGYGNIFVSEYHSSVAGVFASNGSVNAANSTANPSAVVPALVGDLIVAYTTDVNAGVYANMTLHVNIADAISAVTPNFTVNFTATAAQWLMSAASFTLNNLPTTAQFAQTEAAGPLFTRLFDGAASGNNLLSTSTPTVGQLFPTGRS